MVGVDPGYWVTQKEVSRKWCFGTSVCANTRSALQCVSLHGPGTPASPTAPRRSARGQRVTRLGFGMQQVSAL